MVGFIGGLQGRIGKGEQRPAQQNAASPPLGEVLTMPQQQRRRTRRHGQHHAKAGDLQRRHAPGIQPVKDTPVVADDDARHGAQPQHESPPCGEVPYGG